MSAVDGYSVEVSDGYEAASAAWELGPERVYEALDRALLELADDDLAGRRVLDLGSGGGAVSRLVATRGGRPVALDGALGMCRMTARRGVPTVRGDATRLCFRPESFDAVVAAFVLNHVPDPLATLGDVRRVVAPGASCSPPPSPPAPTIRSRRRSMRPPPASAGGSPRGTRG